MPAFLERLRQRKLVQWTVGYLAAAWVVLEVVGTLGDTWGWPTVVGRLAFVSLATGLVVTLVLAWFHGERGRQRLGVAESALLATAVAVGGFAALVVARAVPAGSAPDDSAATPADGVPSADARSLVVLPFADLSPDGGREYLGDGIAETLISGLGRIDELHVVARTSAFQFKGQGLDVREIGRRLGVGSVLDGSVTQIGDRVRITASLYDATSGLDRWSERFDEEAGAEDLFVLQDRVAQTILDALRVELAGGKAVVTGGSRNPEAQRAYFLGMHHWTARTTPDVATATDYFHQAIEADSSYADAWAGLALAYSLHLPSEYGVPGLTPTEILDRAERAARRALELDSTLAEPHAALGWVYKARGRPEEAVRELRAGIEKNPGYATGHHWLADILMMLLRGEEALAEMEIAETLDPVAPAILAEKAQALMILGRTDEAMAVLDRTLELYPTRPLILFWSGWFALASGDWDRAARHLSRPVELQGEPEAVVQRIESGLRDPALRPAFLRDVADGRFGPFESMPGAGTFGSTQTRFLATLKIDGPEAALRFLEASIRAGRIDIYAPFLPAVMGPELSATPEARRVLRLIAETPAG